MPSEYAEAIIDVSYIESLPSEYFRHRLNGISRSDRRILNSQTIKGLKGTYVPAGKLCVDFCLCQPRQLSDAIW